MGFASYGQIGNINPSKPVKLKLKVTDYVFTYQNKDLTHVYLTYSFDQVKNVTYLDGKFAEEIFSPLICFELSGVDELFNTITFSFMVHYNEESVNKLNENPTKINHHIIDSEMYLSTSYEKTNGPLTVDLDESMYHDTANFFVAKLGEKKFILKGSVPSESIFFWFIVDLKK